MSMEMFSGDIADFEAAAARCPFLNSLGEQALAEIRADLEVSLAVPEATTIEEQVTVDARAIATPSGENTTVVDKIIAKPEETLLAPVKDAVIAVELKPTVPEVIEESVALSVAVMASVERQQQLEHSEPLPGLPPVVEPKTASRLKMPEPIVAESARDQSLTVVRQETIVSLAVPVAEQSLDTGEPLPAVESVALPTEGALVSKPAAQPDAIETTPELLAEPEVLTEGVGAGPEEPPTIVELLVPSAELASTVEVAEESAIETTEPVKFSERLEPLITELPLERQAVVRELAADTYNLIAQTEIFVLGESAAEPKALQEVTAELMEQEELVSTVVTLLQELGIEQPTEKHVVACVTFMYAEILAKQADAGSQSFPLPDLFRERTGGTPKLAITTSQPWYDISQRLLARLALARHLVVSTE